jgi:hypothetical protein
MYIMQKSPKFTKYQNQNCCEWKLHCFSDSETMHFMPSTDNNRVYAPETLYVAYLLKARTVKPVETAVAR